jgi:hypothetical protein
MIVRVIPIWRYAKFIADDGLAWAVEGVDLDWMCVA